MSSNGATAEALTYAAANAELDGLIDEIESSSLDVDELAAKVERACELIRFCRNRLEAADRRTQAALASLDAPPRTQPPTETDPWNVEAVEVPETG